MSRIDWQSAPAVTVPIPSCPNCAATGMKIIRTEQGGDGSYSRKCVCDVCSEAFRVIFEPPLPLAGKVGVDTP